MRKTYRYRIYPTQKQTEALEAQLADAQVLAFAEADNPCGGGYQWIIRREGDPLLMGAPERCPCRKRDGFVHIMLDS